MHQFHSNCRMAVTDSCCDLVVRQTFGQQLQDRELPSAQTRGRHVGNWHFRPGLDIIARSDTDRVTAVHQVCEEIKDVDIRECLKGRRSERHILSVVGEAHAQRTHDGHSGHEWNRDNRMLVALEAREDVDFIRCPHDETALLADGASGGLVLPQGTTVEAFEHLSGKTESSDETERRIGLDDRDDRRPRVEGP